MESVTIKKTHKEIWMKKFDDYEESFNRISENEAIESIKSARFKKVLFSDCGEPKKGKYQVWGYWN